MGRPAAIEHKLACAVTALRRIAGFSHAYGCDTLRVPTAECGCQERSQWKIASDALVTLGEIEGDEEVEDYRG